jgi:hypothetical protein
MNRQGYEFWRHTSLKKAMQGAAALTEQFSSFLALLITPARRAIWVGFVVA